MIFTILFTFSWFVVGFLSFNFISFILDDKITVSTLIQSIFASFLGYAALIILILIITEHPNWFKESFPGVAKFLTQPLYEKNHS